MTRLSDDAARLVYHNATRVKFALQAESDFNSAAVSEKNVILSAADRSAEERGAKIAIFGRPGVGKTYLLRTVDSQMLTETLFLDAEAGDLCVADLAVAVIQGEHAGRDAGRILAVLVKRRGQDQVFPGRHILGRRDLLLERRCQLSLQEIRKTSFGSSKDHDAAPKQNDDNDETEQKAWKIDLVLTTEDAPAEAIDNPNGRIEAVQKPPLHWHQCTRKANW